MGWWPQIAQFPAPVCDHCERGEKPPGCQAEADSEALASATVRLMALEKRDMWPQWTGTGIDRGMVRRLWWWMSLCWSPGPQVREKRVSKSEWKEKESWAMELRLPQASCIAAKGKDSWWELDELLRKAGGVVGIHYWDASQLSGKDRGSIDILRRRSMNHSVCVCSVHFNLASVCAQTLSKKHWRSFQQMCPNIFIFFFMLACVKLSATMLGYCRRLSGWC